MTISARHSCSADITQIDNQDGERHNQALVKDYAFNLDKTIITANSQNIELSAINDRGGEDLIDLLPIYGRVS